MQLFPKLSQWASYLFSSQSTGATGACFYKLSLLPSIVFKIINLKLNGMFRSRLGCRKTSKDVPLLLFSFLAAPPPPCEEVSSCRTFKLANTQREREREREREETPITVHYHQLKELSLTYFIGSSTLLNYKVLIPLNPIYMFKELIGPRLGGSFGWSFVPYPKRLSL